MPYFIDFGIKKVGLFGSYVRNEQTSDSDIDVLIELNENSKLTLFDLIKIENHLEQKLDTKIDLVLRKNLKSNISQNILKEVVYF
jgi:predicted nucleotidyltransferase